MTKVTSCRLLSRARPRVVPGGTVLLIAMTAPGAYLGEGLFDGLAHLGEVGLAVSGWAGCRPPR